MDRRIDPRLTESVRGSGWASKLGPGDLDKALCGLPLIPNPNVIRGMDNLDDAGVYRLTDELAIIQTIDFFTPIVDDPYMFGQIALKAGVADDETVAKATKCMATLSEKASELMQEVGVHACTDVTGFGFLGHTVQLAQNSQVGININITSIPFFPEASELAKQGLCPAGLHRNREFYSPCLKIASELPIHTQDILFDPQTSGGLLICLAPRKAELLLGSLRQNGVEDAAIVGEVVSEPRGVVTVE